MYKVKRAPHWVLSDQWGISVDTYNWILKYRGLNKDGDGLSEYWKVKGYWGRLDQLFASLLDELTKEDPGDLLLTDQIQRAYTLSTSALDHFTAQLEAQGLVKLRPRMIAEAHNFKTRFGNNT